MQYVGSTTKLLEVRLAEHKSAARTGMYKNRLGEHMRKLGVDEFYINEVARYENISRAELRRHEQEAIDSQDPAQLLNDKMAHSGCENQASYMRMYYQKKKQDPEWRAKFNEKCKLAMRKYNANKKAMKDFLLEYESIEI